MSAREDGGAEDVARALTKLVGDVDDLIGQSQGVYGLHLNGDPSPWSELTEGGRFDDWLRSLEDARRVLRARAGGTP